MDMPAQRMNRREIPEGMSFTAWGARDGWSLRRFDFPAEGEPRGSLLFLGGRGDFTEKYLEALYHLRGLGWSCSGFDWRGQGGSGRLLADPLVCHQQDFDTLLCDLEHFVEDWTDAAAGPHFIVGHSMGANLAIRLLAERGAKIDGAVLLAPMIRISARRLPLPAIRAIARAAVWAGRGERRLWEGDVGDVGGRMTSCAERRDDKAWWKAARPELASGAPSWGWLNAAARSMARISIRRTPRRMGLPLLLLASERDPVIDIAALRRFAGRLPNGKLRLFPGTGHELLREADPVRLAVLDEIEAFLDRTAARRR